MPRLTFFRALALVLLASSLALHAENWPAWRGADGLGITRETKLPLHWATNQNVRWKIKLPERGNSTPIVWNDRVFITQAEGKERNLLCFDRKSGKQLWKAGAVSEGAEPTHPTNPFCSASPVTDGSRVVAWFGSSGLYCYDLEGRELWHRDLGKQSHYWGYGSSPVLYDNLCFLNFGPGERAFLIAVDKTSGRTVWQNDVPELKPSTRIDGFSGNEGKGVSGSWSTPLLLKVNGRDELIVSLPGRLVGLEPKSGKEYWSCQGLNPLVYTSPIFGDGIVVSMGGYNGPSIAVRPGGSGDVTSKRLWQPERAKKNRLGSGMIYEGRVFVANMEGFMECIDLKTGKEIWEERLKSSGANSSSWSSMVRSGDRIYLVNQSGDTIVFRAGATFEVLALNSLGNEPSNSSLAVSNGDLFIRTHEHLWCISEKN